MIVKPPENLPKTLATRMAFLLGAGIIAAGAVSAFVEAPPAAEKTPAPCNQADEPARRACNEKLTPA